MPDKPRSDAMLKASELLPPLYIRKGKRYLSGAHEPPWHLFRDGLRTWLKACGAIRCVSGPITRSANRRSNSLDENGSEGAMREHRGDARERSGAALRPERRRFGLQAFERRQHPFRRANRGPPETGISRCPRRIRQQYDF